MSKVSGGKRHFGRECCGQGSVVSAAACPSPSSNSSGSDSESSGGSSSGGGDDRAQVKSKKRAIMPANALDDWMLATDRERRSVLVPAGVDADVQQYVDIMFGSGTGCTQNDCGECVPCIARVARKFARSANNSLCMSSISFEQSDAHAFILSHIHSRVTSYTTKCTTASNIADQRNSRRQKKGPAGDGKLTSSRRPLARSMP